VPPLGATANRLQTAAQRTGRYATIALGASIPISAALDGVLFLVVLLAWLAGGSLREKLMGLRANPAALAALAFLGLLLLGMTWGPGTARDGWYYIVKYQDLMLVAVLSGLFLSYREKELALGAFLAAMAITLVLSYAIWLGVLPMEDPPNRGKANPAVFKLHITHGVFMALAAFLAAVQALRVSELGWRVLYGVGALLAAFNVLFMVQGRTGYLVFAVLGLYFFAAHWRWRGVLAAALAAAIALAAARLVDAPLLSRMESAATELQEWSGGRGDTSTGLRMNYYKTSLGILREHPVLGVGTGGFVSAYRERISKSNLPESNNPHNQYLLTGAQLGVIGLLALVAMFLIMWWQAGRLDPPARIAVRGLVLTIAVGSLLNSFLIDHAEGLLFAWMAGVLFAGPRRAQ
jgi:O-antigen ligase